MTKTNDPDSSTVNLSDSEGEANSRRGFLKIGAGVLTTGAAGVLTPLSAVADDFSRSDADSSVRKQRGPNRRSIEAHSIRESAADQHLSYTSGLGTQLDNDDEQRYADEH